MLLLTPPQIGPYAPGGEHHDAYLTEHTALSILIPQVLVLGYVFVVVRAYAGIVKRDRKEGTDEEQTGGMRVALRTFSTSRVVLPEPAAVETNHRALSG